MATFYMKSKIKKIVLAFVVFTSAMFCFSETYLEIADSYYAKDNYSSASLYYEYSLFDDKVSDGKLFYRLGYSYEQLKIKKTIYPKLYSAAAYCFERDNDKDNKYYSYALSKEKDYGINHNNFNEETIKEITEQLYRNIHKNILAYFEEYPEELIWYSVMFIIAILMIIALTKEQEERAKARRARKQNTYSSSSNDEYYENSNSDDYEDSETVANSQEMSRSQSPEKPQYNEKPKTPEIKYYCKYCGKDYRRVSDLTSVDCHRHPNGSFKGKHTLYHGDTNQPFYCKYCGKAYQRLSDLTSADCHRHPKGSFKGKHIPYEGFQKEPWICNECGKTYQRLSDLTSSDCPKHKNGPFKGKHTPA